MRLVTPPCPGNGVVTARTRVVCKEVLKVDCSIRVFCCVVGVCYIGSIVNLR